MAILTLSEYLAWAGITSTDATRDASLTAMISEVNDAIIRYLHNGSIETASYTVIMPAPVSLQLVLPVVPVLASSVVLYLNWQANGNPSLFTSQDLLTPYTDYIVNTGPFDNLYSTSGIVTSNWSNWGGSFIRPTYALASTPAPTPGAIKATFTAGYDTVPPSIIAAAELITSKLYNMRKTGQPLNSEGLQSYQYSAQASATADGIIQGDPTIRGLLSPFGRQVFVGSYY